MSFAVVDNRQNGPDDLDARIARAKAEHVRSGPSDAMAETRGWSVAIEFVGMVLVAAAIGYGFDTYAGLGTKPWAMIGMLILGFAGAVYRTIQASSQFDAAPNSDSDKRK